MIKKMLDFLGRKIHKPFEDPETERRIYEHLNNENDKISEADIRNVKTNIGEENDTASEEEDAQ